MTTIDPETLLSITTLRERGLRPRAGEAPTRIEQWSYRSRSGVRHLWRLDQTVDIKPRVLEPVTLEQTPANILRAVWTVNRAAKRRRDAAETAYGSRLHGFAGSHKRAKDQYYTLKDRGIAWLAHHGHLTATHRHAQLVVWSCDGYRFHSSLIPHDVQLPSGETDLIRQEAKPRDAAELRLIDAVALLERLPSVVTNYTRLSVPWQRKSQRLDVVSDEDDDC
jgi:hypothetical protein